MTETKNAYTRTFRMSPGGFFLRMSLAGDFNAVTFGEVCLDITELET